MPTKRLYRKLSKASEPPIGAAPREDREFCLPDPPKPQFCLISDHNLAHSGSLSAHFLAPFRGPFGPPKCMNHKGNQWFLSFWPPRKGSVLELFPAPFLDQFWTTFGSIFGPCSAGPNLTANLIWSRACPKPRSEVRKFSPGPCQLKNFHENFHENFQRKFSI